MIAMVHSYIEECRVHAIQVLDGQGGDELGNLQPYIVGKRHPAGQKEDGIWP